MSLKNGKAHKTIPPTRPEFLRGNTPYYILINLSIVVFGHLSFDFG